SARPRIRARAITGRAQAGDRRRDLRGRHRRQHHRTAQAGYLCQRRRLSSQGAAGARTGRITRRRSRPDRHDAGAQHLRPDREDQEPAVTAQSTSSSIARASAIVGLGNIASRVLGLVREIVLATIFGASAALESFNNAVLVSRSIFDLLIAGHVSSALVPVMSEIDEKEGRDALYRVLAAMAGLIVLIV